MSPWTMLRLLAACLACAVSLGSCGWPGGGGAGGALSFAGGHPPPLTADGLASVHPHSPVVWGSMMLCLSRPGRAVITAVEPMRSVGGLKVEAFAVRPDPFAHDEAAVGDARGTLHSVGFGHDRTVYVQCSSSRSDALQELAVQASRPGRRDAASHAWRVTYTWRGQTGTLVYPMAVRICGEMRTAAAPCQRLNPFGS